jgi:hypothetical protein
MIGEWLLKRGNHAVRKCRAMSGGLVEAVLTSASSLFGSHKQEAHSCAFSLTEG